MSYSLKKKYTEKRPWGKFERLATEEPVTVKIITVNPHASLSLQYHNLRNEFWRIINGSAKVIVGDNAYRAKEGDEFFIKAGQKHRIETNNSGVEILEISFGKFDENDIVRIEDKYGRE